MTPERTSPHPPKQKIVTEIRNVTKADKEAIVSDSKPSNIPEKESKDDSELIRTLSYKSDKKQKNDPNNNDKNN